MILGKLISTMIQVGDMQGLSFGMGDTPFPTQKSASGDNISLDDLFKPNRPPTSDEAHTNTAPKPEGQEAGEREYTSEDFVISKIDSSGNMVRGKKK